MLASTQSPSAVSGLLLKPEASGSNPVFQNAWAIFQTEDSTFPDPVSTIDRLTSTSARVYALAQAGMTAYYCKKAGDSQRLLGLAVEEANVPSQSEEKPFLLAMLVAICKPLVLSHSPKSEFGRWQESEYRVSTTKLTAPLQRLVAVFNELTQESRALDPELLEHLAEGLCKSLARGEYKQGFIDLYSHLSYQRPPDAATSRFLLTLGEKYEQDFALPVEAAATYQQVYEKYPETAEARKAKLAQIRVLYESKLYDEAYLAAEEVAASPSLDETDRTTGKFMSAFCQGGMGQTEEARGAMAELVELYPQHAIAPQGLYWLATTAMANQEQSAAIEYLRALVERYPDSSFEERARKVMAALQETGKVQ
jgi:tetratricopeptide (TPR) repeat protein